MEKVLCVCLGNISRSPMMQVVLQQHLGSQRQTGPVIARALGLARSTVGLILADWPEPAGSAGTPPAGDPL
jgi:hypothetical protein